MLKQPSSRNHRGKRLRPEQCLQVFLLVAVGIWLMYQLGHSYRRRAVAVDISGSIDGELIRRRWLDRKSLIKYAGAVSSLEDAPGINGGGIIPWNDEAAEWKPRSNKGREDEGDEDDDSLFGYGDGDDNDFHPANGEVEESDEWEKSAVRRINTTSGVQEDVVAQLVNGAADGMDMARERNGSMNTSSVSTESSSGVSFNGNS
ncbi:unnamed protein product [Alopecurus aequalis]